MKKRKVITESQYKNYKIMSTEERSCDKKILNEIDRQFTHAEETKKKIFYMRLDLRFPESMHCSGNALFSRFQKEFILNLKRKGLTPQYIAVAEQSVQNGKRHYHEALWLDGKKTQNIFGHIRTAENLWGGILGVTDKNHGLVDNCTRGRDGSRHTNGVMLDPQAPDYHEKKSQCFHGASYLAKTYSKNEGKTGEREIFSSRIPKKK